MAAPDARDELLAAMFAAWCEDIDAEPFPIFEPALLRGERSPGQELSRS